MSLAKHWAKKYEEEPDQEFGDQWCPVCKRWFRYRLSKYAEEATACPTCGAKLGGVNNEEHQVPVQ